MGFDERLAFLLAIIDGQLFEQPHGTGNAAIAPASIADRLKAMDLLGKYGLGPAQAKDSGEKRQVSIVMRRE